MAERTVVVWASEFMGGAPMEGRPGVRDWKLIYPDLIPETKTLIMGLVEVPSGQHTPLHRHRCEEVYYVLQGRGRVEVDGVDYPVGAGDAAYIRESSAHRIFNTDPEIALRYVVVAGIMLIGLLPQWPTPGPYEILESG